MKYAGQNILNDISNPFHDTHPEVGLMTLEIEHWWHFRDLVANSDTAEILTHHPHDTFMEVLVAFVSRDILEGMDAKRVA